MNLINRLLQLEKKALHPPRRVEVIFMEFGETQKELANRMKNRNPNDVDWVVVRWMNTQTK